MQTGKASAGIAILDDVQRETDSKKAFPLKWKRLYVVAELLL